ncbi:MAG: NAD(P)-dependent oxidoreductase [Deltaproteobacteria bacterium]|nr:NAD(P)-dependent oxidoreductase [Deltaproteobacteria bacterium]
MNTIGLLGVGVMGAAAAQRFIEGGHELIAYDVSPESLGRAHSMGARVVDTPAHVASRARLVLLFLPGPREVEICVAGDSGLLDAAQAGTIIVDMSTVDPKTTRRMAELAQRKDVGYLDAPVLGRPAAVGQWALPVGGRAEDLARCRPILELVAARIFHIGESGSGNKLKLLNQMMFGAINAMTAEMMAVADKVGIPPKTLYETITASQAGTVSNLFKELGGRISAERYDDPTFTVNLLIKDVRLAVEMAKEYEAPPVLGRIVEFINETARAQGFGDADTSIMWRLFEGIWVGKKGP